MRRPIVTLMLVYAFFSLLGQSFEGRITYENSYTSKIPDATSEQFNQMMGTTQEYYVKKGCYKSITDGSFAQWQLYVPSSNRLYNKLSISDTLLWSDGESNPNEAVSYELKEGQEEVLGYKCDVLEMQTKTGKTTYYFSDKIKVEDKLYRDHDYGNWSLFTSQSGSLPLKVVMETPQFILVSVAMEIKEMELEESFFDLPDLPSKQSPY